MRAAERLEAIMFKLEKEGRVCVKSLAIEHRVTDDLIRKDLKKLEKQGLLDRVYGGAERKNKKFETSSIAYRMQSNESSKIEIAKLALTLISSGDHIFLDTSSTSAHIAQAIASSDLEVTVVTDMLYVMTCLSNCEKVTLIAIGGPYNPYTGGFQSQNGVGQIGQFRLDKAFVSCRAVDIMTGDLLEGFIDIGMTKQAILKTAKTKILATQSSKFSNSGVFKFFGLEGLDWIVTDKAFSNEQEEKLDFYKIKRLTVE